MVRTMIKKTNKRILGIITALIAFTGLSYLNKLKKEGKIGKLIGIVSTIILVITGGVGTFKAMFPDTSLTLAADTGYKNPAATGDQANEWDFLSTPSNAYTNDGNVVGMNDSSATDEQDYYNFTFGVPSGATIDGIEVSVEASYNHPFPAPELKVKLSYDGGSNYTAFKTLGTTNWEDVFGYEEVGGATDEWGRTWSDTDFSNTNFRAYFDCEDSSVSFNIDHIRIKVYYTAGAAPSRRIIIIE